MAVLTKAGQVERYLRNAIHSGRWASGEALPAERELLAEFNVSRATLREALNALSHDGLVMRRQGSGTFVADSVETGTVAIFGKAHSLSAPMGFWFRRMVDGAKRLINDKGYRSVLAIGHGDTADEVASSVHLFDEAVIKGTLGVLSTTLLGPLANRLAEFEVPSVSIGVGVPVDSYSVVLDYGRMTQLAVDMLKTYGHTDFSIMHIDYSNVPNTEAFEQMESVVSSFRAAAVGYSSDRLIPVPVNDDPNWGYLEYAGEAFREWWSRPNRPNAIFFYDESLCDIASRVILELGIKVPDDLAVITHMSVGRRFHFPVPFTGVEFDPDETVAAAWDMLSKLIAGEPVDRPVVYIQPRVQTGRSL